MPSASPAGRARHSAALHWHEDLSRRVAFEKRDAPYCEAWHFAGLASSCRDASERVVPALRGNV